MMYFLSCVSLNIDIVAVTRWSTLTFLILDDATRPRCATKTPAYGNPGSVVFSKASFNVVRDTLAPNMTWSAGLN